MKTLEKKDAAIFLSWLEENDHIITEGDVERMYDDELDEYPVVIGSLEYSGSHVLQKVDPSAYRCGLSDYMDSRGLNQLCDYGMDSDDYVEDIDSLWDDFYDEMLVTCDICGDLCLASDAVSISEDDGYSERACPDCIKN